MRVFGMFAYQALQLSLPPFTLGSGIANLPYNIWPMAILIMLPHRFGQIYCDSGIQK